MKETILVVSHDPRQADVRKHRLEAAGYDVISAMSILAVRETCNSRKVHLVVIGYSLPPAEVRRVILEVRLGCGAGTPILELRNHEAATVADSTAVIQHPQEPNRLAEQVRGILEH